MCGGGRRRIWLRGGCAQRAAGQVLIVSTAPVEKTNEPVNETGNRWPRSWRVAWFAETFIAPGEKAGPDTGRRYACTLCGEHGRGARKIEEDKERKGEWDGGEGSIYIPSATFTQKQASVSEGVSQITVRWLLLSSPPPPPNSLFAVCTAFSRSRFFADEINHARPYPSFYFSIVAGGVYVDGDDVE